MCSLGHRLQTSYEAAELGGGDDLAVISEASMPPPDIQLPQLGGKFDGLGGEVGVAVGDEDAPAAEIVFLGFDVLGAVLVRVPGRMLPEAAVAERLVDVVASAKGCVLARPSRSRPSSSSPPPSWRIRACCRGPSA